ncbi:MAG TPA: HDOD domain-containing protein [Candidatus Hydrogenedentes bacterium]|nr:HDOD domain-containing protein [Candidatus Hydrogenedentota bacterium]
MADAGERIVITCACGQKMKVPAEAAGKKFKCVKCGAVVTPPGGGAAAPATAPAAEPRPASRERVGQLLIKEGLITPQQLSEALDVQQRSGGKIIEILIRLEHLDKQALHGFLSKQPGVAAINLSRYTLEGDLVNLIPKELALREMVLPIDRLGKLLTVAMACPLDADTIAELQRITGLKVKAMLCKFDDIQEAVAKLYRERDASASHAFDHILARAHGPVTPAAPPAVAPAASAPTPSPPTAPPRSAPARPLTPELVEKFIAMAEDASVSTKDFARAATEESALAEVLLHAANSGLYGAAGKVRSPGMAIAVLGRDGIADLLRMAFQ